MAELAERFAQVDFVTATDRQAARVYLSRYVGQALGVMPIDDFLAMADHQFGVLQNFELDLGLDTDNRLNEEERELMLRKIKANWPGFFLLDLHNAFMLYLNAELENVESSQYRPKRLAYGFIGRILAAYKHKQNELIRHARNLLPDSTEAPTLWKVAKPQVDFLYQVSRVFADAYRGKGMPKKEEAAYLVVPYVYFHLKGITGLMPDEQMQERIKKQARKILLSDREKMLLALQDLKPKIQPEIQPEKQEEQEKKEAPEPPGFNKACNRLACEWLIGKMIDQQWTPDKLNERLGIAPNLNTKPLPVKVLKETPCHDLEDWLQECCNAFPEANRALVMHSIHKMDY